MQPIGSPEGRICEICWGTLWKVFFWKIKHINYNQHLAPQLLHIARCLMGVAQSHGKLVCPLEAMPLRHTWCAETVFLGDRHSTQICQNEIAQAPLGWWGWWEGSQWSPLKHFHPQPANPTSPQPAGGSNESSDEQRLLFICELYQRPTSFTFQAGNLVLWSNPLKTVP